MSRRLTRIAILGVLLCGVFTVGMRGVPTAHAAAIPPASAPVYTHWSVQTVPLSASEYAHLKAAYPGQANNPRLCVVTNMVEWTDLQSTAGISTQQLGISPDLVCCGGGGGCPSGDVGYHADYNHPPFFDLEMWVTVTYHSDCSVPTDTSDHGQRNFCYLVVCQDDAMSHWTFSSSLEVQHGMNECTAPGFNCQWVYQQFELHTDVTDKYWTV